MFLLIMKSQFERKVDCLPCFKNENWSTSLTGPKNLLAARKVQLLARLVFDIVSIFLKQGKFSQELPCVVLVDIRIHSSYDAMSVLLAFKL